MKNSFSELKTAVFQGAKDRNIKLTDKYLDRINYELGIIENNGFSDYFLLYSYIVRICNELNILRSYGRNSALNSFVNYCLDITKLDPVEHKLIFERFILPSMKQFPDIDIDIPCGFQDIVITNFKAKYPEYFIYYIAYDPQHKSDYHDILYGDIALKKHPCGIIFTKERITKDTFNVNGHDYYFVKNTMTDPFYKNKVDLVELSYLNRIQNIVDVIGDKYHPYKLPLNDIEVYNFLINGDLENVFQVSKDPFPKLLSKFGASSMQRLALIKALGHRYIAVYFPRAVSFKQNFIKIHLISSSKINKILSETDFFLVYQETFLQLCHIIAGMEYVEAEKYRKVITKFNVLPEDLTLFKDHFKEKAKFVKVLPDDEIEQILKTIIDTYMNTLPKGHILSYSIITYWGAYYKTHFNKVFSNIFKE